MRQKRIGGRWLGAACALALGCAWLPAGWAQTAQGDGAAQASSAKAATATTQTTASPSKSGAVKSSGAQAASGKTHSAASHSTTGHSATSHSTHTTASHTAGHGTTTSAKRTGAHRRKSARGQQKIDSERAEEIQTALIREHYLTGEASGTWGPASEDAMRRYQADHGWQTKEVPDSRALISLGLGPNKDHLLNPESAMTTAPEARPGAGAQVAARGDAAGAAPTKSDGPVIPAPAKTDAPAPGKPDAAPAANANPNSTSSPQ